MGEGSSKVKVLFRSGTIVGIGVAWSCMTEIEVNHDHNRKLILKLAPLRMD